MATQRPAHDSAPPDPAEALRLRARITITLAVTRFGLAGPEAGLAVLDEVHEIAARSSPLLSAQAHLQAGAINVMASNWSQALAALEQVEPHLDELVPPQRCAALINRGLAHLSLGNLDPGRADLEAAADLAATYSMPMEAFKAQHNLGCVAYFAGDIPGALRLMSDAAAMDAGVGLARAHLDHAKVLLDAGLVDEAEEVLHRGLAAARRDGQPLERGEIHLDLARAALLRGDVAQARTRAGYAVRTFRSLNAAGRAEEVELFGAAVDLAGRQLARAAKVAARWETPEPTLPTERLATRIQIEVALAHGQLDTAREKLTRLITDQPQPLGARLHEQLLAARLARAQGEPRQATTILSEAAHLLAREQGGVHSMEIRAGLAFHAARIRSVDVATAADSGQLHEVFESVERWRAASHRAPPLRPPEDPETAELVGRLRRLSRERETTSLSSSQHDIVLLQNSITERLRTAAGPNAESDIRSVSFDQVRQAALDRHATLVSFHEIHGTVVRLTVNGDAISQEMIGPAHEIAAVATQVNADLRAAACARPTMAAFVRLASASSLRTIDTLLLAGLQPAGTVVIVPTVALAALSWRALPSLREHPIVATPSATAWVRRDPVASAAPTVTALAGPGLPRSLAEAVAVTKVWGRHTESASPTNASQYAASADVRSGLASTTIVHLAAHGHHVEQSPLFSSLEMADGPVFAHELTAPLSAHLVILSACEVGRSRGRLGDEPLGLAAALLGLGAECVVAATSPVADAVAAEAMVALHERLVAGVDVASGLCEVAKEIAGADAFCAYGNTWAIAASLA